MTHYEVTNSNLAEVHIPADLIGRIADAVGFDYLFDFEYSAPRIISAGTYLMQAEDAENCGEPVTDAEVMEFLAFVRKEFHAYQKIVLIPTKVDHIIRNFDLVPKGQEEGEPPVFIPTCEKSGTDFRLSDKYYDGAVYIDTPNGCVSIFVDTESKQTVVRAYDGGDGDDGEPNPEVVIMTKPWEKTYDL